MLVIPNNIFSVMKFLSIAPLFFLAAAYAQRIAIDAPTTGQTLTRGQTVLVEVATPDTASSAPIQMGIGIGIANCNQTPCPDHSDQIGDVLYSGAYNPVSVPGSTTTFQNFTVTVPTSLAAGAAVLSVAHAALIGALADPFLEVQNVTVTLV